MEEDVYVEKFFECRKAFFLTKQMARRPKAPGSRPYLVKYLGFKGHRESGDKPLLHALAYMLYDYVGLVVETALRKRTGGPLVSTAEGERRLHLGGESKKREGGGELKTECVGCSATILRLLVGIADDAASPGFGRVHVFFIVFTCVSILSSFALFVISPQNQFVRVFHVDFVLYFYNCFCHPFSPGFARMPEMV